MSQPAKAPEPSIDEILASIRRSIVPDDEAGKPPVTAARKAASRKPAAAAGAKGSPPDGDAVPAGLDDEAGDPRFQGKDNNDCPSEPPGETETGLSPTTESTAAPGSPLLSPRTTAAMDTAFHSLTHTVLSQNPRTLEDLVRDMLKPMLKEWLDANLPDMVERLVRAEIERVSRRG
jgi:cell pole-organizing protein PopZ